MICIKALIVFNFFAGSLTVKGNHAVDYADSIGVKAEKLKNIYQAISKKGIAENIYKERFFKEFPTSFKLFDAIYGYDKQPAPLYEEAENHIDAFFEFAPLINDTLFYKKIIALSIGGHWDADAINYLQSGLREKVLANLKLTAFILKSWPDSDLKSFWLFYFDGVHKPKQIDQPLKLMKIINQKVYRLMVQAFNELPPDQH